MKPTLLSSFSSAFRCLNKTHNNEHITQSLQNDENRKLQRSYSKLQGELEKQKKATHGMRLNADRAQAQLEAVRKDLERAKRNTSQRESEVTHKDVRLTRAIEEVSDC